MMVAWRRRRAAKPWLRQRWAWGSRPSCSQHSSSALRSASLPLPPTPLAPTPTPPRLRRPSRSLRRRAWPARQAPRSDLCCRHAGKGSPHSSRRRPLPRPPLTHRIHRLLHRPRQHTRRSAQRVGCRLVLRPLRRHPVPPAGRPTCCPASRPAARSRERERFSEPAVPRRR